MQLQISLAASPTKSLKGAIKLIAKKGFKISDDDHDASIKKGEAFHLKALGDRYYFIDGDGKDMFQFKIDEKKYTRLIMDHKDSSTPEKNTTSFVLTPELEARLNKIRDTMEDGIFGFDIGRIGPAAVDILKNPTPKSARSIAILAATNAYGGPASQPDSRRYSTETKNAIKEASKKARKLLIPTYDNIVGEVKALVKQLAKTVDDVPIETQVDAYFSHRKPSSPEYREEILQRFLENRRNMKRGQFTPDFDRYSSTDYPNDIAIEAEREYDYNRSKEEMATFEKITTLNKTLFELEVAMSEKQRAQKRKERWST